MTTVGLPLANETLLFRPDRDSKDGAEDDIIRIHPRFGEKEQEDHTTRDLHEDEEEGADHSREAPRNLSATPKPLRKSCSQIRDQRRRSSKQQQLQEQRIRNKRRSLVVSSLALLDISKEEDVWSLGGDEDDDDRKKEATKQVPGSSTSTETISHRKETSNSNSNNHTSKSSNSTNTTNDQRECSTALIPTTAATKAQPDDKSMAASKNARRNRLVAPAFESLPHRARLQPSPQNQPPQRRTSSRRTRAASATPAARRTSRSSSRTAADGAERRSGMPSEPQPPKRRSASWSSSTRYLRRGGITKHHMEANVRDMQPYAPPERLGDETDYGSDYEDRLAAASGGDFGRNPQPPSPCPNNDDDQNGDSWVAASLQLPEDDGGDTSVRQRSLRRLLLACRLDSYEDDHCSWNLEDSGREGYRSLRQPQQAIPTEPGVDGSDEDEDIQSEDEDEERSSSHPPTAPTPEGSPQHRWSRLPFLTRRVEPLTTDDAQKATAVKSSNGCLVRKPEAAAQCPGKKIKKKLRFGGLVITEFPIILGDNPAVTAGAPVTIDWNPQHETRTTVAVYERCRAWRRRRKKLLIPVSRRALLLLAAGHTLDEIADACLQARSIREGRQQSSDQRRPWDRLHSMAGGVGGLIRMPLQSTGKQLRKLMVKPVQHSQSARMA